MSVAAEAIEDGDTSEPEEDFVILIWFRVQGLGFRVLRMPRRTRSTGR